MSNTKTSFEIPIQIRMPLCTRENKMIGMVDGAFDLLHYGHIRHLSNCKKLCDVLVVAVACDEFVKQRKGGDRPIVGEEERLWMVKALSVVDYAFICNGLVECVNELQPDVYFKNEDYIIDPDLDSSILLVRMPVYGSTTRLIERIRNDR